MDKHIQERSYGSKDYPFICFGISITNSDLNNFVYHLRYNTTFNEISDPVE